jgi:hypothetical protein
LPLFELVDEVTKELAFVLGSGPHLSAIDFFIATITNVEVGYRA